MALVKWDPFQDLMFIKDRMDKLFEQNITKALGVDESLGKVSFWTPSVDIYETKKEMIIKAELPEINPDEVEIKIENNILTIKGERKLEKSSEEDNYYCIERAYGHFSRSFLIPSGLIKDSITAKYKDGVLKIVIPKKEAGKTKSIKIEVK